MFSGHRSGRLAVVRIVFRISTKRGRGGRELATRWWAWGGVSLSSLGSGKGSVPIPHFLNFTRNVASK